MHKPCPILSHGILQYGSTKSHIKSWKTHLANQNIPWYPVHTLQPKFGQLWGPLCKILRCCAKIPETDLPFLQDWPLLLVLQKNREPVRRKVLSVYHLVKGILFMLKNELIKLSRLERNNRVRNLTGTWFCTHLTESLPLRVEACNPGEFFTILTKKNTLTIRPCTLTKCKILGLVCYWISMTYW